MPAFTNAKQSIPLIFKEIIRNQAEREALPKDGSMTKQQWLAQRALVAEMKSLRRDAERMLHWNTDKGKAGG